MRKCRNVYIVIGASDAALMSLGASHGNGSFARLPMCLTPRIEGQRTRIECVRQQTANRAT